MDLRETECEIVDWIHLAQDRNQWGGGGSCEHSNEPSGSIKGERNPD
jgi:hypothetical protein